MSSGSYKQAYVRCPYYRTDNGKNTISCEGLVPGGAMTHYFRSRRDYCSQIDIFCSGLYWNCEICEALDNKYKEES